MTAPKETDEDGALRPALQALADAVAGLCTPLEEYFESRLITTPSLYLQLRDAVTGEQVNTGGGGGSKSRPPFWTDAFDLLTEIDTALEIWQPAFTGVPATVGRLHWLLQRKWRPQDTKRIETLVSNLQYWRRRITELLNPPRKWTIAAPCPACQVATVYRKDSTGEPVRQAALQIGPDGCQCLNCRYVWEPYRFQILAKTLGYSLPEGVLE
jgi:hypothetical protein